MLAYVTIGTSDLPRAGAFYDTLLTELGGKRMMEEPDYFIAWGTGHNGAGLGVSIPFDKKPASVGNGTMVALEASSREQVDRIHAKALELGWQRRRRAGAARGRVLRGLLPRPRRQQAQRLLHGSVMKPFPSPVHGRRCPQGG